MKIFFNQKVIPTQMLTQTSNLKIKVGKFAMKPVLYKQSVWMFMEIRGFPATFWPHALMGVKLKRIQSKINCFPINQCSIWHFWLFFCLNFFFHSANLYTTNSLIILLLANHLTNKDKLHFNGIVYCRQITHLC